MDQINQEIRTIKQQIIASLILSFMFVMIFATVGTSMAADTMNTNLAQNITAGVLSVDIPSSLEWADIAIPATATNSSAELDGVTVSDNRGTFAAWDLKIYGLANLIAGDASVNNLDIENRLYVTPGDVDVDGYNVSAGGAFMMANNGTTQSTYMTCSGAGFGASNIENTTFNIRVEPSDPAGDYTTTVTFTAS